jgi:hypothetical protein
MAGVPNTPANAPKVSVFVGNLNCPTIQMEDVEVVGRLHQGPTFRSEIISELPNT